ncbi:hypothetical protein GCM10007939_01120 [Amylibacter marinus]|uniref:Rhamnogalacturonase A/B/Epimerase-like pectate lyase domain-containing protein n=1 Tax=Amylibacter marinus TaxID=1475483 RepID=A0ABQ5VRQ6_9RHOB|nr:glycosyl hydrolase family 28-related protein [Amylibacter marinus]GLQ33829.1 hypothetical protein GCM10007939_01120 [Amylibacter marinus]
MNKVITDGVVLMPPAFGDGLDVWSSEDGTPGSLTYDGASNATLISADADFGTCFEVQKVESTQKIRSMAETPMLAGCYLRVSARVKAISGALPSVRIAGWAGGAGGAHVSGLVEVGDSVALTSYGEVVEVSAIIGGGNRTGVDLAWGRLPIFGHFGLDLIGTSGGVVRVEDIVIEDVTSVFLRKMIDVVDVQDYGAIGDGVTDNSAAFEAADADADGRDILVPEGTYYLGQTVTINNRMRFEGTLAMPDNAILQLTKNFEFESYEEAFGDETTALKKGIQALFNFTDHETFDLGGRSISLTGPIDVHAVVGNHDIFSTRRVLKNGEIRAQNSTNWDSVSVTETASYDASANDFQLTNVTNIASIAVGSLVQGTGVGREVYVKDIDTVTNTISLSNALYGAAASQSYTFTRFQYLLDFSGFAKISKLILENIDFNGGGVASGIILAKSGLTNTVKDCFFSSPADRGITSIGTACAGLNVDRNQFLSSEQPLAVADRTTIALNINTNDAKIRNNRVVRFKHFAVLTAGGYIISGNHFFQGDNQGTHDKTAGIVLTENYTNTVITSNYIDNCFIEWNNEHDGTPDNTGSSFSGLSIANNFCLISHVDPWFTLIRLKPYGADHFINGFNISGNVFKISGTDIDKIESYDDSFAPLDTNKTQEFTMVNNSFINVDYPTANPVTIEVSSSSTSNTWTGELAEYLPFGLPAKYVTAITPNGAITNSSNSAVFTQPYAETEQGANGDEIDIKWSSNVKGTVLCTVRADKLLGD